MPFYHPINRYNQLEYEIKRDIIDLNDKIYNNRGNLLENKREATINWTFCSKDPFEILRKAIKDKDAEAGKIIVDQVPEFKNMLEEVAEIGA